MKRAEKSDFKSELYLINNSTGTVLEDKTKRLKKMRQIIIRFIKEKISVTNFYLLNLAITDFSYLLSIPFLLATIKFKSWIFGALAWYIFFTFFYYYFQSINCIFNLVNYIFRYAICASVHQYSF
jgi:hypothetical protein